MSLNSSLFCADILLFGDKLYHISSAVSGHKIDKAVDYFSAHKETKVSPVHSIHPVSLAAQYSLLECFIVSSLSALGLDQLMAPMHRVIDKWHVI